MMNKEFIIDQKSSQNHTITLRLWYNECATAGRTDARLTKKAEVNTMSFPNPDGQKKLDEMYTKLKEHLSDERIDLLRRYFEASNNFYQIITLKGCFG